MIAKFLLHSFEALLIGSSVLLPRDISILIFLSGLSLVVAHFHTQLFTSDRVAYKYLVQVFLLALLSLPLLLSRGLVGVGLDLAILLIMWAQSLFWINFSENENSKFRELILGIIPTTALLLVRHETDTMYLNALAVLSIISSLWGRERIGFIIAFSAICVLEPELVKYWPVAVISILGSLWVYRLGLFIGTCLGTIYFEFNFDQLVWPLEILISIGIGLSWLQTMSKEKLEKMDWVHLSATFLLLLVPLSINHTSELSKIENINPLSTISLGTVLLIIILKSVTKKNWHILGFKSPWTAQFLTSKLVEEKRYFIYREDPLERILGYELLNRYRKLVDNVDMQFVLWFLLLALSMGGAAYWL